MELYLLLRMLLPEDFSGALYKYILSKLDYISTNKVHLKKKKLQKHLNTKKIR